jgi:hypothetical protein
MGCEWDEKTCTNAAKNGHLNSLQWACINGCPQNADKIMEATDGRFPEMQTHVPMQHCMETYRYCGGLA